MHSQSYQCLTNEDHPRTKVADDKLVRFFATGSAPCSRKTWNNVSSTTMDDRRILSTILDNPFLVRLRLTTFSWRRNYAAHRLPKAIAHSIHNWITACSK